MKFSVGVSNLSSGEKALDDAITQAMKNLGDKKPDLAILFATMHYRHSFAYFGAIVKEKTQARNFAGCTVEGVIGKEREFESEASMCLCLLHLPEVAIDLCHVEFDGEKFLEWEEKNSLGKDANVLLLGDPFSFPMDLFLKKINDEYPGVCCFGGMASGGYSPMDNWLFLNEYFYNSGAIAISLEGNLKLTPIVSQGCKPIGKYYIVTKAEKNVIYQLGGKTALAQLQELISSLSIREQQLLQRGLHIGMAVDASKETFTRGDFLMRNIIGVDEPSGAIFVTDIIRPGRTVQFLVRDANTASEDLHMLCAQKNFSENYGALLFSCNGRGQRLFKESNHDINAILKNLGNIPVAGFFAAGEIGPIGGKNFLHGFTASIALFQQKS